MTLLLYHYFNKLAYPYNHYDIFVYNTFFSGSHLCKFSWVIYSFLQVTE